MMDWNFGFFLNSFVLGIGLAMDAFSVSVANSLADPDMKRRKGLAIAGTFGFFQFFMPMMGWILVHTVVTYFRIMERFIPWIALLLLGFIGGKMIFEALRGEPEESGASGHLGFRGLLVQGIATSIDALSVGFTIEQYGWLMALVCALIIGTVTAGISCAGVKLGKVVGHKLTGGATVAGGVILILIGIEIFVKGVFF